MNDCDVNDCDVRVVSDAFVALGGWPAVLGRLFAHRDLSAEEAAATLGEVLAGDATPAQIASFVTALRMKGETRRGDDRSGAGHADPRRAAAGAQSRDLVDTCGTGGDRSLSINVSTIAALVVAGAGARVCKHGGRAATSAAGSADVLEASASSSTSAPPVWPGASTKWAWGSASRRAFIPPCASPSRSVASSVCPPSSTFSAPWPTRPGRGLQVVGVSDPAMAEKMVRRADGQRGTAGHGGPRRRRPRRVVDHGAFDRFSTPGPMARCGATS